MLYKIKGLREINIRQKKGFLANINTIKDYK